MYEAARPGFPDAAVDWLLDGLGVQVGDVVVEIGAGTGKLTRLLVARGLRVQAVEPVAAMRAKLAALGPAVTPLDAVAERLPLPPSSAAGALAAQSFHWVDGRRTLRELERVLVPGGRIGLVWNHRDIAVPWQRELDELLWTVRGDAPEAREGAWRAAIEESPAYALSATASWPWTHRQTLAGVVDRVASISFVSALPAARREELLTQARAIVTRHLGTDDPAAPVDVPYVTEAHLVVPIDKQR